MTFILTRQFFFDIKSTSPGGAIYITGFDKDITLTSIEFRQCASTEITSGVPTRDINGGAFYIFPRTLTCNAICAYACAGEGVSYCKVTQSVGTMSFNLVSYANSRTNAYAFLTDYGPCTGTQMNSTQNPGTDIAFGYGPETLDASYLTATASELLEGDIVLEKSGGDRTFTAHHIVMVHKKSDAGLIYVRHATCTIEDVVFVGCSGVFVNYNPIAQITMPILIRLQIDTAFVGTAVLGAGCQENVVGLSANTGLIIRCDAVTQEKRKRFQIKLLLTCWGSMCINK